MNGFGYTIVGRIPRLSIEEQKDVSLARETSFFC